MTSDPTTPDAVERQYQDSDGNPCDLATLCRREPGWAANRIDTLLAERARHAEELRKVEGERDAERGHATEMEERALDLVRDLRLAQVELHALRSLLPDVRACAEYIVERGVDNADGSARRILAAIDSQGGEGILDALDHLESLTTWRPIETAPRDGTEVALLFAREETGVIGARSTWPRVRGACFAGGDWSIPYYANNPPIGWTPLPAPPAAEGGEGG